MKEPMKRIKNPVSTAVQIALLATAPVTLATAQDDGIEEIAIDEIFVTARKKRELAIEVPMNIAVIGAAEISSRNLITREDVYRSVAGAAAPGIGGDNQRGQLILRGLSGSNDNPAWPAGNALWIERHRGHGAGYYEKTGYERF
jgi:outer membrane cobalamin receptor